MPREPSSIALKPTNRRPCRKCCKVYDLDESHAGGVRALRFIWVSRVCGCPRSASDVEQRAGASKATRDIRWRDGHSIRSVRQERLSCQTRSQCRGVCQGDLRKNAGQQSWIRSIRVRTGRVGLDQEGDFRTRNLLHQGKVLVGGQGVGKNLDHHAGAMSCLTARLRITETISTPPAPTSPRGQL